jgi:hypothetical protein
MEDINSARSREFINRCALYLLQKTRSNELFSEKGKFAKQRYLFMMENKDAIVKYLDKFRKSELLKGRENDIEKFIRAMTDILGN